MSAVRRNRPQSMTSRVMLIKSQRGKGGGAKLGASEMFAGVKYAKPTITKLNAKITRIAKRIKEGTEKVYLNTNGQGSLASNFYGVNLCDWSTQTPVFDNDPSASAYSKCNKFTWNKLKLDLIYDIGNEYSNVDITTFLVSIKDEASKIYDKTTGVLSLTSGEDYKRNSATSNSGQVFLNPKVFNIHYVKRMIMGNSGQNPNTNGNSTEMKYIRRRQTISLSIGKVCHNPYGDIDLLTCNQDPSKQYYLLVFNNNLSIDGEYPLLDFNLLNTVTCPS